jgi:hypothetical protein
MRTATRLAVAAGLPLALSSFALATDTPIPLNCNFNGMVHPGEEGVPDSIAPSLYRSIADRGLYVDGDPGGTTPPALGATPIIGATGIPYTIVNTPATLDIVMLGNRNLNNPYELTAPGVNPNIGIAPDWPGYAFDQRTPQTTTLASAIALDGYAEVGLLFNITNVGAGTSTFTATLQFNDAAPLIITITGRDWFGSRAAIPPAANSGLSVQAQLGLYKSANNSDFGAVAPATQSLNVWEAVIDIHRVLLAGLGDYSGKHLTAITYTYPTPVPAGNRDYAIYATTVRTDLPPPANDECASAITAVAGDNPGTNVRATGSTTSPCGNNDTTDVWFRYAAATTGLLEARTCGAIFDTTIAIYDGCGGPVLACDDNGCGSASRVQWSGITGHTYLIRVAGTGQTNGTFTLHIDDPVPSFVPVPLTCNFNGMVHGATEQGAANLADLNGYRSISDRGMLLSGTGNALNAGAIIDPDSMTFSIVGQDHVLDIVYIGDRNFCDNANHVWGTGVNCGPFPTWLPTSDQTGPHTTSTAALNATFTAQTKLGVLYNISNGGGQFDMVLGFTDSSTATVTLAAPDWFGSQIVPPPGPGVAVQRTLGLYAGAGMVDLGTADANLNVIEGVVTVASLQAGGQGNFAGRTLDSITFQNPICNNFGPISMITNNAGFAIYAATLGNVTVPAACYANCDNSTIPPVLNIQDFACFLNAFAAGITYANCDNSTIPPVLNIQDFACFLNRFAAGCG